MVTLRILITGVTGFTGSYLAEYITKIEKNAHIFGIGRHTPRKKGNYEFVECDLLDSKRVEETVKSVEPEYVFHLAGLTISNDFKALYEVNVIGTLNLLNALRIIKERSCPTTLVVGSSAEYGDVRRDEIPISERNPLRPVTSYGISKVSEDFLGFLYHRNYDMKIIRVRPFNLIGPGQPPHFVCSSLVKQMVEAKQAKAKPEILVGNLESRRDFIDVRDIVKAYWKLMLSGKYGEVYNLGSGKCYSIKETLNILQDIENFQVPIKVESSLIRNRDVPIQVSDISKIKKDVNWKPETPFEKSLQDMLNYERKMLQQIK